jgi:hypothetical protein
LSQIEEDFGEETMVEEGISLELDFSEIDGASAGGTGGEENTIDAEGGLFEFDGFELVGGGEFGRLSDEFKK